MGVPALRPVEPPALPRDARAQAWQADQRVGRNVGPGRRVVGLRPVDRMPHRLPRRDQWLGRCRAVARQEVLRNLEKYREHSTWSSLPHPPIGAGSGMWGGRAGL